MSANLCGNLSSNLTNQLEQPQQFINQNKPQQQVQNERYQPSLNQQHQEMQVPREIDTDAMTVMVTRLKSSNFATNSEFTAIEGHKSKDMDISSDNSDDDQISPVEVWRSFGLLFHMITNKLSIF